MNDESYLMPTKKTPYMGTTEVPPERSTAEIVAELVKHGATSVNTEYQDSRIIGLRWIMRVHGRETLFVMPARIDAIYKLLAKGRHAMSAGEHQILQEKARRVAWRQLLRWVQAQMAMIECGMAEAGEVFFPYIQAPGGETLYGLFKESGLKMLEGPRLS